MGNIDKNKEITHIHYDSTLLEKEGLLVIGFIKFCQKILLIFIYAVSKTLFKLSIEGKDNAEKIVKGPLLIVANHKGFFDPLIIGMCFPFFSKLYPLRYMAHDAFFTNVVNASFFKAAGAFPSRKFMGFKKAIEIPDLLLRRGSAIVMFPEGKCIRENEIGPARPGVSFIAMRHPDVPILPIAIAGTNKVTANLLHFRRPEIMVKIGPHFYLSEKQNISRKTDEISSMIVERIRESYRQIVR